MIKRIISLMMIMAWSTSFGQVKAVTEHGENVLLFNDGTWRSAREIAIDIEPVVLATPKFNGNVVPGSSAVSKKLVMVHSESNDITDDLDWYETNGLSLPVYSVPNAFRGTKGDLPEGTPRSYKGEKIVGASYDNQHNFFIYGKNFSDGRYLIITDKSLAVQYVFDFENYMLSPDFVSADRMFIDQSLNWVVKEGNTLYVSHGHNTYAESSKGMNAYITAIDLTTNKVIWRTKPLVCNTSNFVVQDDMIICGYGFTAEKDYMYVLNKKTGGVAQKLLVKTGPDVIIPKDGKLFVRTYNMNYVFKLN